MLSARDVERFWDVCDDIGVDVDDDMINKAWVAYCNKHRPRESSCLPVSQKELFAIVEESLGLIGVGRCAVL